MFDSSNIDSYEREKFDDVYGEGSLDDLVKKLTFNGIKVQYEEALKNPFERDFQQISFFWRGNGSDSSCTILYTKNYWYFDTVDNSADHDGLFSFMASVMPQYAESLGVKEFRVKATNEGSMAVALGAGMLPAGDDGTLSCSLSGPSRVQEYGEWVRNGKDPALEPSWRKEINS